MSAICTSGSARAGNTAASIGKGILNMFGIGNLAGIHTPMDDLQKEIQELQQKTQAVINQASTQFATIQVSLDEDILKDFGLIQNSLQSYVNMHDEILREKSSLNTYYIGGIYVIVLILLIFFLISSNK